MGDKLVTAFLLLMAVSAAVALRQGIYKGCYEDTWRDRDLYEYYWGSTTDMTINACQATCRKEGFPYCGLQSGYECWCGKQYGKFGKASKCNLPCTGNTKKTCGGHFANDVYTTSDDVDGTPCTPVDCQMSGYSDYGSCRGPCGENAGLSVRDRSVIQEGWCGGRICGETRSSRTCTRSEPCDPGIYNYMGCYKDNQYDRDMPHMEIEDQKMTIGVCVEHCLKYGYKYAGMESGYECWCGDSYGRFGTSVNCNSDCPGDKDGGTFCGGGNSLSVYDTTLPGGCTPRDCVLGSWDPEYDRVCRGPCGENKGTVSKWRQVKQEAYCGGKNCASIRNKVPCTVGPAQCPGPAYVGCYADDHNRDLPEAHIKDAAMTVDKCTANCASNGYRYAGVTNIECWCGDSYGKHGESDKCADRCPGDSAYVCGGHWSNSVYDTSVVVPTPPPCTEKVDCEVGLWSDWSSCDLECLRERHRSVKRYASCGGRQCPSLTQTQPCDRRTKECRAVDALNKGCFRDGTDRDMEYGPFKDKYMTPGKCIYHCGILGYQFAGLQIGDECWCGDGYGKHGASYLCNTPCPGDPYLFCGGGWANSIYSAVYKPPCTPSDCVAGEWSDWGECTGECGEGHGTQEMTRPVLMSEHCGGAPCLIAKRQTCTVAECARRNSKTQLVKLLKGKAKPKKSKN